MIEILHTIIENDLQTGQPSNRAVSIITSSGGDAFMLSVGNLSLTGDLQAILEAREAELWAAAQAGGRAVDLYEVTTKRVLKSFALVVMDEINILRQASVPPLPARTASQIETAIKNKLKGMV